MLPDEKETGPLTVRETLLKFVSGEIFMMTASRPVCFLRVRFRLPTPPVTVTYLGPGGSVSNPWRYV